MARRKRDRTESIDVASVQLVMSPLEVDDEHDRNYEIFRFAFDQERELRNLVRGQVFDVFGEEYEVVDFEVTQGSAVLSFMIAKAATFFASPGGQVLLNASRYESFVKSMTLLLSQLGKVMKGLMQPRFGPTSFTANWQPTPQMMSTMVAPPRSPLNANSLLLSYLILSHATLLGVLLWLVIRHLK